MNKTIIFSILFFICISLNSIIIPYSQSILKTEENHLSEFMRIDPADSLSIPLKTDIWLWHDEENLFVFCNAVIDANFTKGKFANRDKAVDADFLRIQIITDVKNYYAYMFYAYPLGNLNDGIRKSDFYTDDTWNSNYKYENLISNNYWQFTMKIPFEDMRFYGEPPYNWKIIITRYFQKTDEYYSIPFGTFELGKDYFRTACDITIKDEIKKNKNYAFALYFIKKYNLTEKTESFDPENIGLDFSYNPNSATKMKFSINPDFSDVPMDTAEDNFNTRYAPSFEENRYFFVEDLDVFGVSSNLFYSRHIMQPQYAIKLTGNSENFSYGFLSAKDKKITEEEELLNCDDYYNIFAIKPKWQNLSIQTTLLNRMNKNYHNDVFVLNPVWEFTSNHSIWVEADLSYLDKSEIKKGYSFSAGYNGRKGDFDWSTSISKCSKNYSADMGLVYKTDFSAVNANINFKKDLYKYLLKSLGTNFWIHKASDSSNNLIEQNGGFGFWSSFEQKFNFNANINLGQENYENKIHNWNRIYLNLSYRKYSLLNFKMSYGVNHTLVYSLKNVYKQDSFSIGFAGDISTNISYNISTQRIKYFDFPTNSDMDDEYWIGNSDLTINFSNTLSLTNGFRFNNYESTYSIKYLGFFSNFRFEFKENCNLYIGYKTAQDEIEQENITDFKQAYMKVSYTF